MKILYYYRYQPIYAYQWQQIHIFDELERKGFQFQLFNFYDFHSEEEANQQLINVIKSKTADIDLFMTCEGSDNLFPETIKEISKIGLPTLLVCFDNLHAPHMHKKIAKYFDLVWLTSQETTGLFQKWGCQNLVFQPYAANPYTFIPRFTHQVPSVCFIGTPYGSRINKLNTLSTAGIDCTLYTDSLDSKPNKVASTANLADYFQFFSASVQFSIGRKMALAFLINRFLKPNKSYLNRNKHLNILSSVEFEEMQMLYSNHSLSLNIIELRNTFVLKNPVYKLHLRTFEIPMSGGLQITSRYAEILEYFEEDNEIVLYDSTEELVSKARFYLNKNNESLTQKMKQNARRRAESQHCWTNRFRHVISKLELK